MPNNRVCESIKEVGSTIMDPEGWSCLIFGQQLHSLVSENSDRPFRSFPWPIDVAFSWVKNKNKNKIKIEAGQASVAARRFSRWPTGKEKIPKKKIKYPIAPRPRRPCWLSATLCPCGERDEPTKTASQNCAEERERVAGPKATTCPEKQFRLDDPSFFEKLSSCRLPFPFFFFFERARPLRLFLLSSSVSASASSTLDRHCTLLILLRLFSTFPPPCTFPHLPTSPNLIDGISPHTASAEPH